MPLEEPLPANAAVRPGKLAIVVVVAAAVLRFVIAWMPGEWLLRHVLADDSFYYFTIARNLSHGYGLTFDGFEPTNGFHPLWLFVIAPVFGGVHDAWSAVHVALTLAGTIDVLALGLLVVLLAELEVNRAVATATIALYAFSPLLLSLAGPLNGLETPIDLLATFAFLIQYRRVAQDPQAGAQLFGLSIAAALVFLARTDSAILLAFAFASLLWRARTDRRAQSRVVVAGIAAACLATPWLAWSWVHFGSPIQVSGLARAYVTRGLFDAHPTTWLAYAGKVARNLATFAAYVPVGHGVASTLARRALPNAVFVAALVGSAALLARNASPRERRALHTRLAPWWPLLVGLCAFVVVHTLWAVELRTWYFTSLVPVVLLMLALTGDFLARSLARWPRLVRRRAAASVAVVLLAMLGAGWRAGLADRCGESDGYAALRTANQTLSPGTRLGAWNAGLYGYFYERGQVVNLDGLVNNAAYRHIVDRSLGAYAAERRIDYLLDADGAIDFGKRYWAGGRPISFPSPLSLTGAPEACRRILLVPLAPGRE